MEGEHIDCETDQDSSNLEVPAINWTQKFGVKSVQNVTMRQAPRLTAEENKQLGSQACRQRN